MGQKKLLVVSLQTNDPKYIMVANQFHQTCRNFVIENVSRVLSFLMETLHSYVSDITHVPE